MWLWYKSSIPNNLRVAYQMTRYQTFSCSFSPKCWSSKRKAENLLLFICLFLCLFMYVLSIYSLFVLNLFLFLIRDPHPLSVYQISRHWHHAHDKMDQGFPSAQWEGLRISFIAQGLNSLVVVVYSLQVAYQMTRHQTW